MGSGKKIFSLKFDEIFECLMLLNNGVKEMLLSFSFVCGIFLLLFPALHPLISRFLYSRSWAFFWICDSLGYRICDIIVSQISK